jgi:dTDP-4-dehydrorhamnose reductase
MNAAESSARPKGKRLLVTGASGLLGANFVNLARAEWSVTAVSGKNRIHWAGVDCRQLDLTRRDDTLRMLDSVRPDIIVHLAAITSVDWCENNTAAARVANVETTHTLASWAADHGARLVFMSTDSVFDGAKGNYREADPVNPLNCYATTKVEAETAVREAMDNHTILRAAIYGWNAQNKLSLAEWALKELRLGHEIPGFIDVFFSPVLVTTLADTIKELLRREASGTFHAGSLDALSKYDFAVSIGETFGIADSRVHASLIVDARLRAPRPLNTSLDSEKLRVLCGIAPTVRADLMRFRREEERGHVAQLKHCISHANEHV